MSNPPPDLLRTFSGSIATYYDTLLGPAWYAKLAEDVARRMPADPGGDVLEIACGTGLMTRPLRERLDPRHKLFATDLNKPMLEYASAKLAGMSGIEWQEADAVRLPFPDGRFAAVACSLGVMFIPDRAALLNEVRRVLRPGGHFIFDVWDDIEKNDCMRVYSAVIRQMFPGDKELDFRLPYEMADDALLRRLLQEGGFRIRALDCVHTPVQATARDVATGQIRGTPRGSLLAKRGVDFDEMIDKVTAALEAECGRGEDFRANCHVLVVEAERSA